MNLLKSLNELVVSSYSDIPPHDVVRSMSPCRGKFKGAYVCKVINSVVAL